MKKQVLLYLLLSIYATPFFAQSLLKAKKLNVFISIPNELLLPNQEDETGITCYPGKIKNLAFPDMVYFNPYEKVIFFEPKEFRRKDRIREFYSLRFLLNESHQVQTSLEDLKLEKEDLLSMGALKSDVINEQKVKILSIPKTQLDKVFQPFFFRKFEVTNGEYKTFIQYVKDSIAHCYLDHYPEQEGNEIIDWTAEIDWKEESLSDLFIEEDGETIFNPKKLVYSYLDHKGNKNHIPISPNEKCWEENFPFSYNAPMTNNYFSHPVFDDHPMVGINYHQAKAFCHWKTKQIKASLPYSIAQHILVDLPRDYEWEWIATERCEACQSDRFLIDDSWVLDLQLATNPNEKLLREYRSNANNYKGQFTIDGSLYPHQADLSSGKEMQKQYKAYLKNNMFYQQFSNLDFNQVSCMGSNVSEWLDDAYQDWSFSSDRQLQRLSEMNTAEANLAQQIMLYYDDFCDKDGYLVRGGNWYDERYSVISGKNKAGIQAKTFISPSKSFSTVGFRYVIRLVGI